MICRVLVSSKWCGIAGYKSVLLMITAISASDVPYRIAASIIAHSPERKGLFAKANHYSNNPFHRVRCE